MKIKNVSKGYSEKFGDIAIYKDEIVKFEALTLELDGNVYITQTYELSENIHKFDTDSIGRYKVPLHYFTSVNSVLTTDETYHVDDKAVNKNNESLKEKAVELYELAIRSGHYVSISTIIKDLQDADWI